MSEEFERAPELAGFDALVPVPLHPQRLRERGYNQAHLLGQELGAKTGLPILDLLDRRRGSAPAWRLGRIARRDQLAGAFAVNESMLGSVKGKRLLLVDDVCASATTLEECAIVLRRSGARDVAGYVFTRAGRSA